MGKRKQAMETGTVVEIPNEHPELLQITEVQQGIQDLVESTRLQLKADLLRGRATINLIPHMVIAGAEKLTAVEGEVWYSPPGTTSKFNKDRCRQLLVEAGVDPLIVGNCFTRATETTDRKEYIKFKINPNLITGAEINLSEGGR